MRAVTISLCVLFAIVQTNNAFTPAPVKNPAVGLFGVPRTSTFNGYKALTVSHNDDMDTPKLSLKQRIKNRLQFRKKIRHMAVVVATALAFRAGSPQIAHAKGAVATPVKASVGSMKGLPAFATVTIAAGAGTAVATSVRRNDEKERADSDKPAETGLMKALLATQADKETSASVTREMDENERLKTKQVVEKMLERAELAYKVSNVVDETPEPVASTPVPAHTPAPVEVPAPQPVQIEARTEKSIAAVAATHDRVPPIVKTVLKPKALKKEAPKVGLRSAEDYSAMPLEERAFNILVDLGMVEITPDPTDPSYDSSKDHLFVGE
mmetsp:Transcript_27376/g.38504  ORF Transcript_27376/g.38504 Transcript_27376/m.38504 type:complete len:325 (+) Transcript_27376:79-1053(+)